MDPAPFQFSLLSPPVRPVAAPSAPEPRDDDARESRLDIEFRQFHAENPHIYRMLRTLAREWVDTGRRHLGMKMLWEVARWNLSFQTTDEEFKLNNNLTSRYARLLMAQEPDLDGIFETRTLTSRGDESDCWATGGGGGEHATGP